VGQEIEQLKASIEQLKNNQEQMARDNARAAEQFQGEPRTNDPRDCQSF
jgi:outer membrane murein-binding lipoprotein Lpp